MSYKEFLLLRVDFKRDGGEGEINIRGWTEFDDYNLGGEGEVLEREFTNVVADDGLREFLVLFRGGFFFLIIIVDVVSHHEGTGGGGDHWEEFLGARVLLDEFGCSA